MLSVVKPIALVVVCLAATASAGPLDEALRRHSDRDVAMLRGRDDAAARCTLGAVFAKRRDLPRAALYLRGCEDVDLPDEIAADVARIARELTRRLADSELAQIEVVTHPDAEVSAEITALPGETFTTPATLYLPAGEYTVRGTADGLVVTNRVIAQPRSRGVVILELGVRPRIDKKPGTNTVDFSEETATDPQTKGPPPKVAHKSLLPNKYQRGVAAAVASSPTEGIDDPLATMHAAPRGYRPLWLGLRLGGGVFAGGGEDARAGMAVAGAVRMELSGPVFAAGRLDYSRRGGGAIDTLGLGAGIGHAFGPHVAVLAQLRGELHLGDAMAARAGLSAAAGVELALPGTPLTAGLRFEHGLTTLAAGARDRAVLLEVGVDWR
jgi:hypothetical protein